MEHETEQQVSPAATDVALPSFTAPRPGGVIDVRRAPQPPTRFQGRPASPHSSNANVRLMRKGIASSP